MADNRNRKQDRKAIKRLEKAIRGLKAQIDRTTAIDPLAETRDEEYDLAQMEAKLAQMLGAPSGGSQSRSEWDDRDEDRDDRVRRDRDRKGHRKAKHSRYESDDEDWAA